MIVRSSGGFVVLNFAQVVLIVGLTGLPILSGCRDNSPPPSRVAIPAVGNPDLVRRYDAPKPLPGQDEPRYEAPAPMYNDVPLLNQRPPEQAAFVQAYRRVGQPRVLIFVNRTLEGDIVPVNKTEPIGSIDYRRTTSTGVTHEQTSTGTYDDYWRRASGNVNEKFSTTGPGEYRETLDVYLKPGQYDEVQAKSLDYEAVENILTDWIAANGQTNVVSPLMARERLTDEQVKELQSGRPRVVGELVQQLQADVLIQVQARPTRQTRAGLEVRLIAEALNTRGGQSIGRAVVDIPAPLEKTTINKYTRFVARKLMDDMTGTWNNAPLAPTPVEATGATTQPVQ